MSSESCTADGMQVTLKCLSADAAQTVFVEHIDYFGAGVSNTVRVDGSNVVIEYFDRRWPMDIAEWAAQQGHASDESAARVIASL